MGRKFDATASLDHDVTTVWEVLPSALDAAGIEVVERDVETHHLKGKKKKDQIAVGNLNAAIIGGSSTQQVAAKKTFGEKIMVTLDQRGDAKTSVWVESRLRFGLIDYGENRKNVDNILAALRQQLDQG